MNYVIFKDDGSIDQLNLDRYIQQGSHGVDKIYIGFQEVSADELVCNALFTLPNQTTTSEAGIVETFEVIDEFGEAHSYNGFAITLEEEETRYNGLLVMAVRVNIVESGTLLVNYPITLVVNETGARPEADSGVTLEELDSYLKQLENYQIKLVSGVNIKTINHRSLLGSGNINIEGGSGTDVPVFEASLFDPEGNRLVLPQESIDDIWTNRYPLLQIQVTDLEHSTTYRILFKQTLDISQEESGILHYEVCTTELDEESENYEALDYINFLITIDDETSLPTIAYCKEKYLDNPDIVTSVSDQSTDKQVPSAKCLFDNVTEVMSVAEGKCKTYVLSCEENIQGVKQTVDLESVPIYYQGEDCSQAFIENRLDYLFGEGSDPEASEYEFANLQFNSTASSVNPRNGKDYATYLFRVYDMVKSNYFGYYYVIDVEHIDEDDHFKTGDIFLVIETDVPDRWWAGKDTFYCLEGDLSNCARTNVGNEFTVQQKFNNSLLVTNGTTYDGHPVGLTITNQGWVSYIEQFGGTEVCFDSTGFYATNSIRTLGKNDHYWGGVFAKKIDFGTNISGRVTSCYIDTDDYDGMRFYCDNTKVMALYNDGVYFDYKIIPNATDTTDIGSTSKWWNDEYISGKILFKDKTGTNSRLWRMGNTQYGTLNIDTSNDNGSTWLNRYGFQAGSFIPTVGNTVDLGFNSVNQMWKDLYLSGEIKDGTNSVSVANIAQKGNTLLNENVTLQFNNGYVDIPYSVFTPYFTSDAVNGLVFFTYNHIQAYVYLSWYEIDTVEAVVRTAMPVTYGANGETTIGNLRLEKIIVGDDRFIRATVSDGLGHNVADGYYLQIYLTKLA